MLEQEKALASCAQSRTRKGGEGWLRNLFKLDPQEVGLLDLEGKLETKR
jgi:hypothetical protein